MNIGRSLGGNMYYCASSIYSGPIYNNFKTSKRTIRREHRQAADKRVTDFFWYLVNKTRNCSNHIPGSDITLKGVSCKSNETILKGWETYFNELYSLESDPNFKTQFKDYVSSYLTDYMSKSSTLGDN